VELNVFGIDHARTRAKGHRQSIPTRSRWIAGIQIDLTQTPCCQNGVFSQDRFNLASRLIKNIGSMTGKRMIDSQGIERMVREGQQINRGLSSKNLNIGLFLQLLDKAAHDSAAGHITHMQNTPFGVRSFQTINQLALLIFVESYTSFLDEKFRNQIWAFLSKHFNRFWIADTIPGNQHIFFQRCGRIIFAASNDAPLRVKRI